MSEPGGAVEVERADKRDLRKERNLRLGEGFAHSISTSGRGRRPALEDVGAAGIGGRQSSIAERRPIQRDGELVQIDRIDGLVEPVLTPGAPEGHTDGTGPVME